MLIGSFWGKNLGVHCSPTRMYGYVYFLTCVDTPPCTQSRNKTRTHKQTHARKHTHTHSHKRLLTHPFTHPLTFPITHKESDKGNMNTYKHHSLTLLCAYKRSILCLTDFTKLIQFCIQRACCTSCNLCKLPRNGRLSQGSLEG